MKQGLPKSEEDWIKLVQRQEMLHQLELEKWHDLLGTATHLLRQVPFFTIFLNFEKSQLKYFPLIFLVSQLNLLLKV